MTCPLCAEVYDAPEIIADARQATIYPSRLRELLMARCAVYPRNGGIAAERPVLRYAIKLQSVSISELEAMISWFNLSMSFETS